MRPEDVACVMRSQVSAFNVSVLIGSKSLTAFRAIANDTAHDQHHQFFARVLGTAREGQTCLLGRQVREGAGPTWSAEMTNCELAVPICPFQRRRLRNVRQERSSIHPLKYVRARKPF